MKKFITLLMFAALSSTLYAFPVDSFEDAPVGDVPSLKRPYGTFQVETGMLSVVNGYAATGNKSLRIQAEKSKIKLTLESPLEEPSILTFCAQRWTKQKPFKFKVLGNVDGVSGIKELYNGDKTPMQYNETPKIKLPRGLTTLWFESETGGTIEKRNGGLLIDNFYIRSYANKEIQQVNVHQSQIPMILNYDQNNLLEVRVIARGEKNPPALKSVTFTFNGCSNLADIDGVSLYYKDNNKDNLIAQTKIKGGKAVFNVKTPLLHDENIFILRPILSANIDLTHRIDAQCVDIQFDQSNYADGINVASDVAPLLIGMNMGPFPEDNCKVYRIPGMTRTPKGTLIAVWDNRYNGSGDLQGNIDIGMRRSTDGGKTWSKLKTIMDMGTYGDRPQNENGVTDPCVLVDDQTGTIWVAALWLHGKPGRHAWGSSEPGMDITKTGQFMLVKSEDDGLTWSKPINLTPELKNPEWQLFFQGPGCGITMKNGTIVFPAQYKDANRIPHSTIVYSQDHGKTWHVGNGAKPKTTESQVIELSNGSLMLNMRDDNGGSRSVCVSNDLGKTWTKHPTDRSALQDPVCMGSLIRWPYTQGMLFFSNPNTRSGRHSLTIKASLDEGNTWPIENQYLYDARNSFGYSCLAPIDENTLGVLYEERGYMFFIRIPIKDIIRK